MKKLVLIIVFTIALSPLCFCMDETTEEMLSYADLSEVENNSGGFAFSDTVRKILNGEYKLDFKENVKNLINRLTDGVKENFKMLALLCLTAVFSAVSENIKSSMKTEQDVQLYIFSAVIVIYGTKVFLQCISEAQQCLLNMLLLTNSLYPAMLTYIAAGGGTACAAALHPVLLVCGGSIMLAVKNIVFPVFSISMALKTANVFSDGVNTGRLTELADGFVKWTMGIMMTLFVGAVTVTGATAKTFDSITVRTAKYAIGSFIPMVGGVISDSFDLILNGSSVIKSSVGIAGLINVLYISVTPCIKLAATAIAFNICAAVCEPICSKKISDTIAVFGKSALTLFGILCALASMFILCIGVLISIKV